MFFEEVANHKFLCRKTMQSVSHIGISSHSQAEHFLKYNYFVIVLYITTTADFVETQFSSMLYVGSAWDAQ